MPGKTIRAPLALIRDPDLTPAAKVLWLALRAHPEPTRPTLLAAQTGLTLPTLRKSLAQLTAAGWYSPSAGAMEHCPSGPQAAIPVSLLADRQVRPRAKLLFALLQTLPQCGNNSGTFTYASLSAHAQVSAVTARQLIRELTAAGWLQAKQTNHLAPVQFSLGTPALDKHSADVARAKERLNQADFRGEAIMKEYLSLLIASDEFEDNARPGFLINPQTEERLELDRYYPPGVAFEYNGPQHYRTTKRYPNPKAVAAQQVRDLIKEALCARRGIRLVVIHQEDLRLETMRQKVGTLLPLRNLRGREALIQFLEQIHKG